MRRVLGRRKAALCVVACAHDQTGQPPDGQSKLVPLILTTNLVEAT